MVGWLVLVVLATPVWAQQLEKPVQSDVVQCSGNALNAQTAWVVSPSGIAARGTVEGKSEIAKDPRDNQCDATWQLEIRDSRGKATSFNVANTQNDWTYEHYFKVLGWNRDGTVLFAATVVTAGDWEEEALVIYDTTTKQAKVIKPEPLLKSSVPQDCSVFVFPRGFSAAGKILLEVGSTEMDLPEGQKPCFATGAWEMDLGGTEMHRAKDETVLNFGKAE